MNPIWVEATNRFRDIVPADFLHGVVTRSVHMYESCGRHLTAEEAADAVQMSRAMRAVPNSAHGFYIASSDGVARQVDLRGEFTGVEFRAPSEGPA